MTTALALPVDGDSAHWSEQEKALVKAAGLVRSEGRGDNAREFLADRPTVEAFLAHCRRTGLDPIARQIYAIYRGGKWGIQISIDGARLVAERSGQYEGQTSVQWTDDGVTWVDVWLKDSPPRAARVGVYRRGFREPLYAVANWDSYVVTKDEWENGRKTGRVVVSDMWQKFGPLMLGKCAEMLALRKAFPQDLSGLYTTEEMGQAQGAHEPEKPQERPQEAAPVVAAVVAPDVDWAARIADAGDIESLRDVYRAAQRAGAMAVELGSGETVETVETALWARQRAVSEPVAVDVPVEEPKSRDWVREARGKRTSDAVDALWREASALGASSEVLDQLQQISAGLPVSKKAAPEAPAGGWPVAASEAEADAVEAEVVEDADTTSAQGYDESELI